MKLEDFAESKPVLQLEDYFNGRCQAWGIFEDRRGNIKRQFAVEILGQWDGSELIIHEDFRFVGGGTDRRVWNIRKTRSDTYEGVAEGVIGIAKGRVCGQAFRWRYRFALSVGKRRIKIDFDDWMFLQPDGVLINRATMRKFGFVVGRVWLFFHRNLNIARQQLKVDSIASDTPNQRKIQSVGQQAQ